MVEHVFGNGIATHVYETIGLGQIDTALIGIDGDGFAIHRAIDDNVIVLVGDVDGAGVVVHIAGDGNTRPGNLILVLLARRFDIDGRLTRSIFKDLVILVNPAATIFNLHIIQQHIGVAAVGDVDMRRAIGHNIPVAGKRRGVYEDIAAGYIDVWQCQPCHRNFPQDGLVPMGILVKEVLLLHGGQNVIQFVFQQLVLGAVRVIIRHGIAQFVIAVNIGIFRRDGIDGT